MALIELNFFFHSGTGSSLSSVSTSLEELATAGGGPEPCFLHGGRVDESEDEFELSSLVAMVKTCYRLVYCDRLMMICFARLLASLRPLAEQSDDMFLMLIATSVL